MRKHAVTETFVSAIDCAVSPGPLLNRCLDSIKLQTLPPPEVYVIRDVVPAYKAKQQGLEKVNTDALIVVDDDMILKPDCFESMLKKLQTDDRLGDLVYPLNDPLYGSIIGIHMYRTQLVQKNRISSIF